MVATLLDVLTTAALTSGLFFMFIGALGIWRMPDFFNRMHASSKCITLGITGLLLAVVFHLWAVQAGSDLEMTGQAQTRLARADAVAAATKALLVVVFQFVAAPVGAHMLARAAHRDGIPLWEKNLSDELKEDAIYDRRKS